jgi:hypothetical protein
MVRPSEKGPGCKDHVCSSMFSDTFPILFKKSIGWQYNCLYITYKCFIWGSSRSTGTQFSKFFIICDSMKLYGYKQPTRLCTMSQPLLTSCKEMTWHSYKWRILKYFLGEAWKAKALRNGIIVYYEKMVKTCFKIILWYLTCIMCLVYMSAWQLHPSHHS